MKLYINGDSHAAAAEAVVPHAFAEDDGALKHMGRAPHPANAAVSWARVLADTVKATLYLDAESASSNTRIRRTTRDWIKTHRPWLSETVMMIQWSTWEREEWWIDGQSYQVTASGTDDVPAAHANRYRQWVTDMDWRTVQLREHNEIWQFHQELDALGVRHVFFNGNNTFKDIAQDQQHNWGNSYIEPYNPVMSYDQWLKYNKFRTVSPDSWHFGQDAHVAWARFMLQYGMKYNLWK
jgi:hypothetical protein